MKDRKQRVQVDRSSWEWTDVTSGILGPLLFLIYIKDFPDVVHSFIKLFADDARGYAVVNTARGATVIQDDLVQDDRYSNLFLNAYINRHAHAGYL